jgi:DNA-binding response OmpR family regulator
MAPTILVADRAADTVALLARQLERGGYRCVTAASGVATLAAVDARRPDACVLEVMLGPGPSGYEVVRQLRAAGEDIPLLLMSARAGKLDRDFAFTVGANDYFRKPFRCGELITRLETLVPVRAPVAAPPLRRRGCQPRPAFALAAR